MGEALGSLAWPRHSARLSLRPLREDDLDAVFSYRRLPDVDRWMTRDVAERAAFDATFWAPERRGRTLVVELEGQVVGDLMLMVRDGWSQADVAERAAAVEGVLGWCLHPARTGRGLATEAVRALLAIALSPAPDGLGLRRVVADCFADNERSWRLMERVGMRRETRSVAESLHRDLGWVDSLAYALLAEEWHAR